MSMSMLTKTCLLGAMMAPGLALADEPAPPPAQTLATLETILEHCAKVDPEAADQYREQARQLAQGASDDALAELRKSDEYQKSRNSTLESLAKVDDQNAKKACSHQKP